MQSRSEQSHFGGVGLRRVFGIVVGGVATCALACAALLVPPVAQAHAASPAAATHVASQSSPQASSLAATAAPGATQTLNSVYSVSMTQSPSNPISAGQKVTYTYTLTDNAWPGTRFSGATNNSKGGLILTDSACPASNMQIVSGIAYYHPGYGTLLSGGTAVLQCTTTYPTAQKVTHQLTVQPGVLNFVAPVAQLPVSSVSGTYPSALNPYQTVVNPPTINTGDFQLGQRVETNPVNTGSGEKIVLSLAHVNSDSIYGQPLTVTYKLPAANLRISSATATGGGTCSVNAAAGTVTCTYPASAFGPSATSQISIAATGAGAGVAQPTASISTPGKISTYNSVNSTTIIVAAPTNTGTPSTSAEGGVIGGSAGTGADSSDLGTYSLTATASTNYISQPTKVTYTYVLRNNSARDVIAAPAGAAASSIVSGSACADATFGAGWSDVDGHKIIAPGQSATIVCTATIDHSTTNTVSAHNLTFANKDANGTWNWADAQLAPVSASVSVTDVSRADAAGEGTAADENMPEYISAGASVPISCAVPSVWNAANMAANGAATADTSLYHQWKGARTFDPEGTAGTYAGQGAYWQWNLGGANLPYSQTSYWTGSGSNAFKPVTGVKYSYSALAYNPQNRLLYALTNSDSNIRSGQVITIDANGTIRRTGVYLPYPVWNVTASTGDQNTAKRDLKQLQGGVAPYSASGHATGGFNAGFFDDSGNYYVAQASTTGTGNLYKIDPLTGAVSQVLAGSVNSGAWSNDFSYSDGYAYGIENPQVVDPATGEAVANPHAFMIEQINLATGAIKYIARPLTASGAAMRTNSPYGASWTYGNGDLGFDANSGYWYHIRILNPASANPTAVMIASGVGSRSYNNDGAACAELPADLSIAKTQETKAAPGANVTWKVTVKNNGPGASSGFAVKDTLPAGFTYVAAQFDGSAGNGSANGGATDVSGANASNGTCAYNPATRTVSCVASVGQRAFRQGQSRVIEITAKAPATNDLAAHPDENCYTNTASVDGNEVDPDAANNSASTPMSCIINSFAASKVATSKWLPAPGSDGLYTVNYTIAVKNTGVTPAYYWQLTDSPDLSDVDIQSVTWAGGPSHASATAAAETAAGSGVWNIGSGLKKTLPVGATDTYTVAVKFALKKGVGVETIPPCVASAQGYTGGIVNRADAAGETEKGTENVSCIQPKVPITVKKLGHNCDTDKLSCPLTGAEFALYGTDPSKPGATPLANGISTDANRSTFTSVPLKTGKTYWLLETKSPKGHELMATPIAFSVSANSTAASSAAAGDAQTRTPAYAIAIKDSTSQQAAALVAPHNKLELDVYDTTISSLPVAGVPLRIPWLLIGLAVSLIGMGIATGMKRKREQK